MILKIISILPAFYMFIKFSFFSGTISISGTVATMGFSIAVGTVMYYMFNGVRGSKKKVVFGIEGREIGPFAGVQVPIKVVLYMFGVVFSCCGLALVLNYYGI